MFYTLPLYIELRRKHTTRERIARVLWRSICIAWAALSSAALLAILAEAYL